MMYNDRTKIDRFLMYFGLLYCVYCGYIVGGCIGEVWWGRDLVGVYVRRLDNCISRHSLQNFHLVLWW